MEKQSFWNHGIGYVLRRIFVIAIVWVPIYFALDFGSKGVIGCLIGEFVLLILATKLFDVYKKKKGTNDR